MANYYQTQSIKLIGQTEFDGTAMDERSDDHQVILRQYSVCTKCCAKPSSHYQDILLKANNLNLLVVLE